MVLVLDTNRELELHSAQLTDLAPVATVQQHLVLQIVSCNILVEDLSHFFRCGVVQGVSLGRAVEGVDDGARWGSVDDSRGHNLDHVIGVTETVAVAVGREQTTGTTHVDITGNEGDANTALLGDGLEQFNELLLLLGVDVAGPGVDQVVEQLGSELAKDILEGLALAYNFF